MHAGEANTDIRSTSGRRTRLLPSSACRAESGFTIFEALVAALILIVGLLAAFFVLTIDIRSSRAVKAREGGVALAREITEDARQIPYSQITSDVPTP